MLFLLCACKETVQPYDEKQHDYIHGKEGYYSLFDEGYVTKIKNQEGGTCWLNASSTSMESNYLLTHNKQIEIDPMTLLEKVYLRDKGEEGYHVGNRDTAIELGGWPWIIIGTVANGFDDYFLESAYVYEDASIDEIKEVIKSRGGIDVSTNDGAKKTIDNYVTLNDPKSESYDHEVVIIGWDDNFPKDYFYPKASANGAWLAQNSMSDKWGNKGTYWISYETPLVQITSFAISDEYSRIAYYDGGNEGSFSLGDSTTVGNLFNESGKLKAVGIYSAVNNEEVLIEIYSGKFEKLLSSKTQNLNRIGYHVIQLDKSLDVSNFSISVTYKGKACVEGETWGPSAVAYTAGINPNESFVKINEEWIDMSDSNIKKTLKIDFEPNNACIKALFE